VQSSGNKFCRSRNAIANSHKSFGHLQFNFLMVRIAPSLTQEEKMATAEKIKSKLEKIRMEARAVEAQLARQESVERERKRLLAAQDDARRKSLIGGIIHAEWKAGNLTTDKLMSLISHRIKKDSDFPLFQRSLATSDGVASHDVTNTMNDDGRHA